MYISVSSLAAYSTTDMSVNQDGDDLVSLEEFKTGIRDIVLVDEQEVFSLFSLCDVLTARRAG